MSGFMNRLQPPCEFYLAPDPDASRHQSGLLRCGGEGRPIHVDENGMACVGAVAAAWAGHSDVRVQQWAKALAELPAVCDLCDLLIAACSWCSEVRQVLAMQILSGLSTRLERILDAARCVAIQGGCPDSPLHLRITQIDLGSERARQRFLQRYIISA